MNNLFIDLETLKWTKSSHAGVFKKVCFFAEDFKSNITQVAYTEINEGVEIEAHSHCTMEELFFLFEGVCEVIINGVSITLDKQSVFRVAQNQLHSIRAISHCKLFYFGVAV